MLQVSRGDLVELLQPPVLREINKNAKPRIQSLFLFLVSQEILFKRKRDARTPKYISRMFQHVPRCSTGSVFCGCSMIVLRWFFSFSCLHHQTNTANTTNNQTLSLSFSFLLFFVFIITSLILLLSLLLLLSLQLLLFNLQLPFKKWRPSRSFIKVSFVA